MSSVRRLAKPLFLATCLLLSASPVALAKVRREGTWPEDGKKISLDVSHVSRSEAVKRVADAAGWSVVLQAPPGDPVELHVKEQAPEKLLELLLSDGEYVATRDGALISIARAARDEAADAAPAPASPSPSPAPAAPSSDAAGASAPSPAATVPPKPKEPGPDRTVAGGSVTIEAGQVLHNVDVFGGDVRVRGTITGDLSLMGGSVHLDEGGRILGNARVFGGEVTLAKGARLEGKADLVGGSLHQAKGSFVGGAVSTRGGSHSVEGEDEAPSSAQIDAAEGRAIDRAVSEKLSGVGSAITRAALLFAFGAILIALAGGRMDLLRGEAAARPMRSLALGVVGSLGAILLFVVLCVTVIGVPLAIIGVLLGTFAVFASMCAVLQLAGEMLLRHKTQNPYVHLALGCLLFLVLGAIPYIGGLVTALVTLMGIGTLVATRAAGFVVRKGAPGAGPYRTAP